MRIPPGRAQPGESRHQIDRLFGIGGCRQWTTFLGAGNQTLSVIFTPTDTTDYADASDTVTISVTQATPTITWAHRLWR